MRSLFLVVPKAEGEVIRKNLLESGHLNKDFRIESDAKHILIPLTRKVDLGLEIVEREARAIKKRPKSYRELVQVPAELLGLLPTAFDVVGDVILLKLADELLPYSEAIGRAMREAYGIRTVAIDEGVKGDYRIRRLRVIHGDQSLVTTHRAYGVNLEVDLSRCYFSPRMATETWRVAGQAQRGERIVDMFAGVGPFALTLAKHAKPSKVYAIDSNPHAFHYLKRNIARNKLNVTPILGDSREVMKGIGDVDRVIVDLPHSSLGFVDQVFRSVPKGTVHYYEMLDEMSLRGRSETLKGIAGKEGKFIKSLKTHRVRSFSPSEAHFVFDIEVE